MLGENIKNLRKNRELTQNELATRLNVTEETILDWETGASLPDAELLEKLSEILETDVGTLTSQQCPTKNKSWGIVRTMVILISIIVIYYIFMSVSALKALKGT